MSSKADWNQLNLPHGRNSSEIEHFRELQYKLLDCYNCRHYIGHNVWGRVLVRQWMSSIRRKLSRMYACHRTTWRRSSWLQWSTTTTSCGCWWTTEEDCRRRRRVMMMMRRRHWITREVATANSAASPTWYLSSLSHSAIKFYTTSGDGWRELQR